MSDLAQSYDVIVDDVITPSAAVDCGPIDFIEHVSRDPSAAHAVVEIDAVSPRTLHIRAKMMDEIEPDDVSAITPVAPGIDRSGVACEVTDATNLVLFDYMVVPGEKDGRVRQVFQKIGGGPIPAAAGNVYRGMIGPIDARHAMNSAIGHEVLSGGQRRTNAATQQYSLLSAVDDLALVEAAVRAAYLSGVLPAVAEQATFNPIVIALVDAQQRAPRGLKNQAPQSDVLGSVHLHEAGLQNAYLYRGPPQREERRPEVKQAVRSIHIVLARFTDLLEQVVRVVGLVGARAKLPRRSGELARLRLGIDRQDLHVKISPGIVPKPVQPDVLRLRPAFGPCARIDYRPVGQGGRRACQRLAGLWPTCERHRPAVDEEFQRGNALKVETSRLQCAIVGQPVFPKAGVIDVSSGFRVEAGPCGQRIDHRPKPRRIHVHRTGDVHLLALCGRIGDGPI